MYHEKHGKIYHRIKQIKTYTEFTEKAKDSESNE